VHEFSAGDTSIIFIGSSRVQKSTDPDIINGHYDHYQIVNLGVMGGNFLSNCVLADFVIQQRGHKIIFIELAPLIDEVPNGLEDISAQTGLSIFHSALHLTQSRSLPEQSALLLNMINQKLYNSITLRDEVREVLGYGPAHNHDHRVGFHPEDKNDFHQTKPFLQWKEIRNHDFSTIDLTSYEAMIHQLEGLAKANDTQIVYFIPITYRTQIEKSIVLPLYRALPDSMKLEFSENFLQEMTRAEYLMDENHLNREGATEYSRMIIPLMRSKLKVHS
jgi:hypothetical protein